MLMPAEKEKSLLLLLMMMMKNRWKNFLFVFWIPFLLLASTPSVSVYILGTLFCLVTCYECSKSLSTSTQLFH